MTKVMTLISIMNSIFVIAMQTSCAAISSDDHDHDLHNHGREDYQPHICNCHANAKTDDDGDDLDEYGLDEHGYDDHHVIAR